MEDGTIRRTIATVLGTMARTTEDITAVSTTLGTMEVGMDFMIHGTIADGTVLATMEDGMAVGTRDTMIRSTIICIHTIADGTADGTLTTTAYISDLHMEDTTTLSATHPDEAFTEVRATTPHQAM